GRTGLRAPDTEFTRLGRALDTAPDGDAYLAWVVREVVPRVERVVRASTDPADRGFGGASLGGLITLRAAQLHADTFGRFLCESPSLTARGRDLVPALTEGLDTTLARVFIGMGGSEYGDSTDARSRTLVEAAEALAARLEDAAQPGTVTLHVEPDAAHNEAAWADRFDDALRFLYPVERD
ncbi:MAG: alpha/beta hydrolase-fold protein, partial [Phycisphaerales bacterium JB041]